jgi:hypothetical protein
MVIKAFAFTGISALDTEGLSKVIEKIKTKAKLKNLFI